MEAKVFTQEGKEAKSMKLPEAIFGVAWNADLVSQVLFIQASNRRAGTAHTKDRSEVSGGGRKPWNQKGSGRARHGSSRSPIWRHGGVTHGPRNDKNYKKTLTPSMRNAALVSLLSAKLREGKLIFVDTVAIPDAKTKGAETVMKNLSSVSGIKTLHYKKVGNVMMTVPVSAESEKRAFRNLPYVNLTNLSNLNPLDIANTRYLVITNPEETIKALEAKLA